MFYLSSKSPQTQTMTVRHSNYWPPEAIQLTYPTTQVIPCIHSMCIIIHQLNHARFTRGKGITSRDIGEVTSRIELKIGWFIPLIKPIPTLGGLEVLKGTDILPVEYHLAPIKIFRRPQPVSEHLKATHFRSISHWYFTWSTDHLTWK
jgi:hypothetical protein